MKHYKINKIIFLSLFIVLNILLFMNTAVEVHNLKYDNNILKACIGVSILVLMGLLDKKLTIIYIILLSLCFLTGTIESVIKYAKIISFFAVFYVSYRIGKAYRTTLTFFLVFILFVNALFIIIEINGLIPTLAYYQTYYPPTEYIYSLFIENQHFPLFQIRPHGIYTSTIYLSFEMMCTFGILLYKIKSYFIVLLITFLAVFSGSNALFLTPLILGFYLFIVKVNNSKISFLLFLSMFGFYILYTLMYPSFSHYNYNILDLLGSFDSRFNISSAHSSYTSSLNLFLYLIFPFFVFTILIYISERNFMINVKHLYILLILLMVFAIHDFVVMFKLYLNFGLLVSLILYNYGKNNDK